MNRIWRLFLQGIALLAPVALTLALLFWLITWSEKTFGGLILRVLPDGWYFQGMGVLGAVMIVLLTGLAANLFLVRRLVKSVESVLQKTPLVTSLYQAFKDVARLFSKDAGDELGEVVAVEVGGVRMVGFVMQAKASLPGAFDKDAGLMAVYIAMSYQLGGFTVYVPRDQVEKLEVTSDQAIRAVLTGGELKRRDDDKGAPE